MLALAGDRKFKMQLRQRSIVIYTDKIYTKPKVGEYRFKFNKSESKKPYSGKVTTHSQRRIRKAVQILTQKSKWQTVYNPITMSEFRFKLNFITLTIPDLANGLSGKESYKLLLKPFLQTMQRVHGMRDYIWKAELQQRGTIHYHITTNTFINYMHIKKRWNQLLDKAGLMQDYKAKHNHSNPNSTDIHKVYNDENIEAYLEKYISKNENTDISIHGKVWDCSVSLKSNKLFTVDLLPQNELNIIKLDKSSTAKAITSDFFEIIYFNEPCIIKLLYGYQHKLYNEWLASLDKVKLTRSRKRKHSETAKVLNHHFTNSNQLF